jgi:hypothetical protein
MRSFIGIAALAAALAAGCGSSAKNTSSTGIPASVANRLAAQSESIAAAWDAGDQCGAAQQADDLRHAADQAIADGSVPAAYQDDLDAAVTNLQNSANCPPPSDEDPGNDEKGKDKGKAKGHDKHDPLPTLTTTTTTTTTTATTTGEGD